jgi:hypothetical protein
VLEAELVEQRDKDVLVVAGDTHLAAGALQALDRVEEHQVIGRMN